MGRRMPMLPDLLASSKVFLIGSARKSKLRTIIGFAVIASSLFYLGRVAFVAGDTIRLLQINWILAPFVMTLTIVAVLLSGLMWWLSLRYVGADTSVQLVNTVRSHFISQLAKYLPGSVWQPVSKGLLTLELGVPSTIIMKAMLVEVIVHVFVGAIVAVLFCPPGYLAPIVGALGGQGLGVESVRLVLLALSIGGAIALPLLVRTSDQGAHLSWPWLTCLLLVALFVWAISGLLLWLMGLMLSLPMEDKLSLMMFTVSAAVVTGFLVLVAPAGFGVRESVIVALLSGYLAPSGALLLALMFRVVIVVSEITVAGGFSLPRLRRSLIARGKKADETA